MKHRGRELEMRELTERVINLGVGLMMARLLEPYVAPISSKLAEMAFPKPAIAYDWWWQ